MSTPKHFAEFNPSSYSHLREFLRGYLHEDWPDECATLGESVEKFWMDTGTASVLKVAEEWDSLQRISGGELKNTQELLDQLGGAWHPASAQEIKEMSQALAQYKARSGRK
jgi:hypothetical protein